MGVHQTNVQNDTQQQQQIVVVDGREGGRARVDTCVCGRGGGGAELFTFHQCRVRGGGQGFQR